MIYYFKLQQQMLNRHLSEFGVHPLVGYLLSILGFVGLSFYLFYKTEFAPYIYAFFALSLLMKPGESRRNDFLKSCFSKKDYLKIRLLENLILTIPFVGFLIFKTQFLLALALLLISCLLSIIQFKYTFSQVLPTPFYKSPFEFTVGFRRTFAVIFFAYFLTFMAIMVDNFNLGIFSVLVVLFTCLSFYSDPENKFFVWIFALSPQRFLWHKIKIAILFSTMLCLPIDLVLSVFFPERLLIILGFQALGYLYLLTFILGKYSTFPREISLPQGIILAVGLIFPPLLLGIIPYFYDQSITRLNDILE